MRHQRIKRKLSAFLDGALPEDERSIVESHLDGCALCRGTLERMKASWGLLDLLPEAERSPHAFVKIQARMATPVESASTSRLERFLVPASAAAALMLGIWVGSVVGKNGSAASYTTWTTENTAYLETFDELPSGSLARAYIDLASTE